VIEFPATHYECETGPEMMVGNRKLSGVIPGQQHWRGSNRNQADPELWANL
jgi:hypothetical protein